MAHQGGSASTTSEHAGTRINTGICFIEKQPVLRLLEMSGSVFDTRSPMGNIPSPITICVRKTGQIVGTKPGGDGMALTMWVRIVWEAAIELIG